MSSKLLSIDPTKAAKYPIVIGPQLLDNSARGKRQTAVIQFNHKPTLSARPKQSVITHSASQRIDSYDLSITVDESGNKFQYTGAQQPTESCALIYDPKTQTFTLDRISADFTFNLRSTPTNQSSQALAAQYPLLDTGISDPESNSDDVFDEDDAAAGADANNPYDYRHFLKSRRTSSPEPLASTPLAAPSPPSRAASRPKPKPRPRPQQKSAPSPPPREEADADNEDSDDGGLTIEMDPDTKPRRMGFAFNHDARNGPTSLHSAASSMSPAEVEIESIESDEDMDVEELRLEDLKNEEVATPGVEEQHNDNEDNVDEVDNDDDDDDDDEGGLEAELEQALESQADEEENGGVQVMPNGIAPVAVEQPVQVHTFVEESSSESEEE